MHVLDGATGKALSSFTASEEGVNVCRFWGNDELLVGDAGGDISHWSLADTSKALRHYRGHDVQVKNVEVVNERYFLSCAFDGCLRLWDRYAQPPYWPEGVPGVSPAQVYNLPGRRLSANTLFYHLDLQRIALHRGGVDDWVARGRPFTPTAQLSPLHRPHADTTSGHAPRWPVEGDGQGTTTLALSIGNCVLLVRKLNVFTLARSLEEAGALVPGWKFGTVQMEPGRVSYGRLLEDGLKTELPPCPGEQLYAPPPTQAEESLGGGAEAAPSTQQGLDEDELTWGAQVIFRMLIQHVPRQPAPHPLVLALTEVLKETHRTGTIPLPVEGPLPPPHWQLFLPTPSRVDASDAFDYSLHPEEAVAAAKHALLRAVAGMPAVGPPALDCDGLLPAWAPIMQCLTSGTPALRYRVGRCTGKLSATGAVAAVGLLGSSPVSDKLKDLAALFEASARTSRSTYTVNTTDNLVQRLWGSPLSRAQALRFDPSGQFLAAQGCTTSTGPPGATNGQDAELLRRLNLTPDDPWAQNALPCLPSSRHAASSLRQAGSGRSGFTSLHAVSGPAARAVHSLSPVHALGWRGVQALGMGFDPAMPSVFRFGLLEEGSPTPPYELTVGTATDEELLESEDNTLSLMQRLPFRRLYPGLGDGDFTTSQWHACLAAGVEKHMLDAALPKTTRPSAAPLAEAPASGTRPRGAVLTAQLLRLTAALNLMLHPASATYEGLCAWWGPRRPVALGTSVVNTCLASLWCPPSALGLITGPCFAGPDVLLAPRRGLVQALHLPSLLRHVLPTRHGKPHTFSPLHKNALPGVDVTQAAFAGPLGDIAYATADGDGDDQVRAYAAALHRSRSVAAVAGMPDSIAWRYGMHLGGGRELYVSRSTDAALFNNILDMFRNDATGSAVHVEALVQGAMEGLPVLDVSAPPPTGATWESGSLASTLGALAITSAGTVLRLAKRPTARPSP